MSNLEESGSGLRDLILGLWIIKIKWRGENLYLKIYFRFVNRLKICECIVDNLFKKNFYKPRQDKSMFKFILHKKNMYKYTSHD